MESEKAELQGNDHNVSRRGVLGMAGLAALGASGLGLASCTSATDANKGGTTRRGGGKKRTIVWATHVYYNQPALIGIEVGFRDFCDLAGWNFKVTAAKTTGDVQQTIQAQNEALQLKPDAIVATMTDPTSFNKSLKAIIDAGIFLQLNNTQPDQGNGFDVPYIGQSFTDAGVAAAKLVLSKAKDGGKTSGPLLLGYCCGNQGAVGTRTKGLKQGVNEFNKENGTNFTTTELLDTSDSAPASATGQWQAKLRQVGDNLVGIVADGVGNPTIDAAKAAGKKPGFVPIGTFDVTDQRLTYLDDGWFTVVVDQQPYAQGWIPAVQAYMWLEARTRPTALYDTGSALITKDGVGDARKNAQYIHTRGRELKIAGA